MNKVEEIFSRLPNRDGVLLEKFEAMSEPRNRYIVAMTPRSGSSYLCDVMTNTRQLGEPDEYLNTDFLGDQLQNVPARTPEEYLRNVFRHYATPNGISGLKTSWFQFKDFTSVMADREQLQGVNYIYLTRRNIFEQAISLYCATATSVFHTNATHDTKALNKLEMLEYDYEMINEWHRHIIVQENGWQDFFQTNGIFPLYVMYEDIRKDIGTLIRRIASYVSVPPENVRLPEEPSIFRKLGNRRNVEWACRYALEFDERERSARKPAQ